MLLLVALLLFTSPNGDPIYVAPDQVVSVSKGVACDTRAHTQISFGVASVCVIEPLDAVVKKLSVR